MRKNIFVGIAALAIFAASSVSFAAKLEGVELPDSVKVEGKDLALNGIGLRKVTKFGIPVKVYVGGLYLENKSQDSDAILASGEVKRMVMTFVRPVDRDALLESFQKGYGDACFSNCADKGKQFGEFAKHIRSVRKDNQIILTFYPDRLFFETTGPNAHTASLSGADLSKNLLSVFINKNKPPTPEFRAGVLGLPEK